MPGVVPVDVHDIVVTGLGVPFPATANVHPGGNPVLLTVILVVGVAGTAFKLILKAPVSAQI
jgi:hypothetical protein